MADRVIDDYMEALGKSYGPTHVAIAKEVREIMEAELTEAKRDTERLDRLLIENSLVLGNFDPVYFVREGEGLNYLQRIRDYIDAAMKESQ